MKILIVTPYFYPAYVYGGPIEVSYQTGKAWVEQGHEVFVVTTNANGTVNLDVETKIPIVIDGMEVFYCKRMFSSAISLQIMHLLVSRIKNADIVVLHFVYSFTTIPTILLCRIYKKKLIWRPHGALQNWVGKNKPRIKKFWNIICKILLPPSAHLVFASQKEREECGTIFQRFNTAVVPNGAIVPAVLITKTASKKIRLMFLGRINRIKGLENLITAMMMVDSKTFTLDIYGTGEKKYVESLNVFIGKHQLSDRVFMRGGISHSSLLNIFANTDCLVLPSHLESFGQVVVESLAHGVPVIVSTGAPWKQIDLVGCGLWVKNDSKSLASAIIKMSKLDMVKMGIRGRNWIKSDFDWSLGAQKIIALSAVEERT